MKLERLREAGVRHLEYLFAPAGLPLVPRHPEVPPTTSIAVRGAAGTGKTTLALSLARALADHAGQGAIYYLSTEVSPADPRWKAKGLGLADAEVGDARSPVAGQRLFVDHLSLHPEGEDDDPGVRTRRALDLAWAWVEEHAAEHRVRALIVDAFSLVGARREPEDRTRLLQLLQALEAKGIVPILVEEVGVEGGDWVAYLVDLVFELSWEPDPDTGVRLRKLACPKSRYATALYGPHDYGRDLGIPAVWPALADVVGNGGFAEADWKPGSPGLLLPRERGRALYAGAGSLVATTLNRAPALHRVLVEVPWIRWIGVTVSSTSQIGTRVHVGLQEGPHSLCWSLLDQPDVWDRVLVVSGIGFAIGRKRFHPALLDSLQSVAALGAFVVVILREEELAGRAASFHYADAELAAGRLPSVPLGTRLLEVLGGDQPGDAKGLLGSFEALATSPSRSSLLVYTALHAAYTSDAAPLDWLLALTDPAERRDVAPWVVEGLLQRGRVEEAELWLEIAREGREPLTPEGEAVIAEALAAARAMKAADGDPAEGRAE